MPPSPELALRLRQQAALLPSLPVVAGFDGFVDEIIRVVETRQSTEAYTAVETLARMAEHFAAAAGRSALREIVIQRQDAGGCAVNLGDGLNALGVPLDYFGTLGEPIHRAFADFAAGCRSCQSWGPEPGRTLALEFADGKYMLSAVKALADFTPAHVATLLADGRFAAACTQAKALCITNWSMYPHMTACWETLLAGPLAQRLPGNPEIFFDLVDPGSRSTEDLRAMLTVLRRFGQAGRVTLGVNVNEANALGRLFGFAAQPDTTESLPGLAADLRQALDITAVVIHGVHAAAVATDNERTSVAGPYCAKPRKLTGAGDRFNAGWVTGGLLAWSLQDRLHLATATSGYFVREARSANPTELAAFMERWSSGSVG